MLRRRHKKSKTGCIQCRQRHVKCDESKPTCMLCTMSSRVCSFGLHPPQKENLSPAGNLNIGSSNSQGPPSSSHQDQATSQSHDNCQFPPASTAPLTSISLFNPETDASNLARATKVPRDPIDDFSDTLDLSHMELFIHLTLDKTAIAGDPVDECDKNNPVHTSWTDGLPIGLRTGLKFPYLLHELLAISARHLAVVTPDATRAAVYQHQAVLLQTKALSLFGTAWAAAPAVDRTNCEAVLLFSAVLGHHVLADTLAPRDDPDLKAFVKRYVSCVEMHRGIHAVATSAWPLLLDTRLAPILTWSSALNRRSPRGNQCAGLNAMLDAAMPRLSPEDAEACHTAVRYLQVGFDTVLASEEERSRELGNPHEMILSWNILASPRFTTLLAERRPEVLVLLAYYALLLHYGRHMWQVRDAGPYVMKLISDHLGPEWDRWLEYPRNMML